MSPPRSPKPGGCSPPPSPPHDRRLAHAIPADGVAPPAEPRRLRPRENADPRRRQLAGPGVRRRRRRADLLRVGPGAAPHRHRRHHVSRLHRLMGPDDPRAPASPRGDGDRAGARHRHQLRRADRGREPARGADRRRRAVDREGADGELRHRGRDDRGPARPRLHRPRRDRQVRRQLPRPCRQPAGGGRLGGRHARRAQLARRHRRHGERHPGARIQRARAARRPVSRPRRLDRGRPPGAGRRQHGAGRAHARVSRRGSRPDPPSRRAVRLRRGDDGLPAGPRRRPGTPRHRARSDHPRQDRGRWPAAGGLRRSRRRDGPHPAGREGVPGRHALGESARRRRGYGHARRASRAPALRRAGAARRAARSRVPPGGGRGRRDRLDRPGRQHDDDLLPVRKGGGAGHRLADGLAERHGPLRRFLLGHDRPGHLPPLQPVRGPVLLDLPHRG